MGGSGVPPLRRKTGSAKNPVGEGLCPLPIFPAKVGGVQPRPYEAQPEIVIAREESKKHFLPWQSLPSNLGYQIAAFPAKGGGTRDDNLGQEHDMGGRGVPPLPCAV